MKRLRRKLALWLAPELAGAGHIIGEAELCALSKRADRAMRRIDLNGLLRFAYRDQAEQAAARRYQPWREGLRRLARMINAMGGKSS